MSAASVRVVAAGWGTTVQDHGRPGLAHLGVPSAGAVDREAHDRSNRLVGNPQGAATIETRGGLVIEAIRAVVAATSADGQRHTLQPGDTIRIDPADGQMWAYLALRGGIDIDPVLGSRSTDTLSGLGPAPIPAGAELRVGQDPGTELVTDQAPVRPPEPTVRLWSAPRTNWFRGGRDALVSGRWMVSNDVSRVGVRLSPGVFERDPSAPSEMASEGLIAGAVQITPAGEPIVMLADHPTTGGYPVIGVVDPFDLPIVAQAMPGSTIRFTSAGPG